MFTIWSVSHANNATTGIVLYIVAYTTRNYYCRISPSYFNYTKWRQFIAAFGQRHTLFLQRRRPSAREKCRRHTAAPYAEFCGNCASINPLMRKLFGWLVVVAPPEWSLLIAHRVCVVILGVCLWKKTAFMILIFYVRFPCVRLVPFVQ